MNVLVYLMGDVTAPVSLEEHAMKARDVMTSPVIWVDPDASVLEAIRIMLRGRLSGLPVIDKDGRLVGIVTEGDFLRRAEIGTERHRSRWRKFLAGPGRLAQDYARSRSRKVGEIMTSEPVTVGEEAPLEDIVKLMEKNRIKRVPVVHWGKVVGIVSRANLLHALASATPEAATAEQSDQAIRTMLLAELAAQSWAPVALINPVVRNGVVELHGTITDHRERAALVIAAENVPGVKAVHDHLVWVDPASGMVFDSTTDEGARATAS
jgi:CBS domain-containing protein